MDKQHSNFPFDKTAFWQNKTALSSDRNGVLTTEYSPCEKTKQLSLPKQAAICNSTCPERDKVNRQSVV